MLGLDIKREKSSHKLDDFLLWAQSSSMRPTFDQVHAHFYGHWTFARYWIEYRKNLRLKKSLN